MKTYKTCESVCIGHPDKLCDLIADTILDECLRLDRDSRVACEVMATGNKIIIGGEITCAKKVNIKKAAKAALNRAGYDPHSFSVMVRVRKQSRDIAEGVDQGLESKTGDTSFYSLQGAGDQGTVYGYATRETTRYLPLPLVLAHDICLKLDKARKDNTIEGIHSDGKAQVTIEYEDGKPNRVESIVVSIQHDPYKDLELLKSEIISKILWPAFEEFPFDEDTEIFINPTGRFTIGGPKADTGLTGRKLMVDTYGGLAKHGGGAFSGKDPSKVDRSGAYMARFVAKNIVASKLAEECEVGISYVIGKADPVMVSVNTFGTGTVSDEIITKAVLDVFNFRPAAIIEKFRMKDCHFYLDTATYGHFKWGNNWEWVLNESGLEEAVKAYEDDK